MCFSNDLKGVTGMDPHLVSYKYFYYNYKVLQIWMCCRLISVTKGNRNML